MGLWTRRKFFLTSLAGGAAGATSLLGKTPLANASELAAKTPAPLPAHRQTSRNHLERQWSSRHRPRHGRSAKRRRHTRRRYRGGHHCRRRSQRYLGGFRRIAQRRRRNGTGRQRHAWSYAARGSGRQRAAHKKCRAPRQDRDDKNQSRDDRWRRRAPFRGGRRFHRHEPDHGEIAPRVAGMESQHLEKLAPWYRQSRVGRKNGWLVRHSGEASVARGNRTTGGASADRHHQLLGGKRKR